LRCFTSLAPTSASKQQAFWDRLLVENRRKKEVELVYMAIALLGGTILTSVFGTAVLGTIGGSAIKGLFARTSVRLTQWYRFLSARPFDGRVRCGRARRYVHGPGRLFRQRHSGRGNGL